MTQSITGRRFSAFHAVAAAVMTTLVLALGVSAAHAQPGGSQLTPEQRREVWQRMTPAQREQWRDGRPPGERQRSAPPFQSDSRPDMRGQVSPDERQAMRQRFREQQQGRSPNLPEGSYSRRQLSPEERQQLRRQVEQARDQYQRGNGGKRGPGK